MKQYFEILSLLYSTVIELFSVRIKINDEGHIHHIL